MKGDEIVKDNPWVIDDSILYEEIEYNVTVEELIEMRERDKKLGIDDGISDEEFEKIITRLREEEKNKN